MKILNTSGLNFYLEKIIENSLSNLYLISPYIKLCERVKELIKEKTKNGTHVYVIYGKKKINASDLYWLKSLNNVEIKFCPNLHAKCYANENYILISSLNLYEFSQVNNYELGIVIAKTETPPLYNEAYKEISKIIKASNEIMPEKHPNEERKLTSSALAKKLNINTEELHRRFDKMGYLAKSKTGYLLTPKGESVGGEARPDKFKKGTFYFLWPENIYTKKTFLDWLINP
ncbi:phospholipase D family protein [Salmonella enterica]|nr:phospholipase D family protein [Salmonella enterica]